MFAKKLVKYTGISCFCCDTILCSKNWAPKYTMVDIIGERERFKNACMEVVHRVVIDVIKRKYLNEDVDIIQWLY